MIPLTMAQVDERRVEVASLTDQIRALGRRRRHLEREILAGYALPSSGDARQLALPVEDKADLDEAASEAVAEVMAKQGKAPQSRAKNEKAPAKEPAVLGPLTMTQVRQAILDEIGTWKRWHSGAAADQALWAELRRTGHDEDEDGGSFDVARAIDDVGMQALTSLATEGKIQCSEKPGNWGNLYAPLHVPRTAEGGPEEPKPSRKSAAKKGKASAKKATKPARKAAETKTATPEPPVDEAPPQLSPEARQAAIRAAILDELGHGLATFGELLTSTMRALAEARQGMPKHSEMHEALELLCRIGSVEKDKDGKSYRLPPPPAPEPKKKGKKAAKVEAPSSPPAAPPADAADCARDRVRWDFILETVEKKITKHPLHIVPEGDAEEAICRLLTDAGALLDDGNLETSCEIPEKHAGKACLQVTREYLYDLLDEKPGQTAAELAGAVEVPEGLVAALLAQLARAKKLRVTGKPHALRWHAIPAKEKRPKPHAQDRTLPILPDLQPAPAREEAAE